MSNKNIVKVNPEVRDLCLRYLEAKKRECRIIRDNLKTGDFENIEILGHRMKGSGKTIGFEKITELGRVLEEAAEKENIELIGEICSQLLKYIENTEVE